MMANDVELLRQFACEQSQDAFTTLVNRHLGLVYCAALRQVRSPHLAEEIAQSVFTSLARNAAKLSPNTVLSAWLYRATRNASVDVIRAESRRHAREQFSLQMSALKDSPADWSHIEPLLDEAMDSLDEPDRTAVLLRYFENKSLQEVGAALGTNEDAAQKRVSRAVDRLRDYLAKRKVAVATTGLAAVISANAVQAMPAALATAVASSAVFASAAVSSSTITALTNTTAIAMTTTQKIIIAALLAAAIAASVYEGAEASRLRSQLRALPEQQRQIEALKHERDNATAKIAQLTEENAALKQRPADVLKLRNQVGQLKRENNELGSKSALSKVTADPATRKMMRDQQKLGMSLIYKGFMGQAGLTPDQKEKFTDLLADHVMNNVDNITTALRDKPSLDQLNQTFAAQDAALRQQVSDLLGPEIAAQYNDYTKNLIGTLTADEFAESLSGTDAEKKAKGLQLAQAIQTQAAAAIAAANLPSDYQPIPILNFANIASQQEGDQSLALLQSIYQQASAQAGSFLSPDELQKFQDFTTKAVNNNRAALLVNRSMMAPISQS